MDERELLAEALVAAESAYRLSVRLAAPTLERLERAAISGLRIPRSTIALACHAANFSSAICPQTRAVRSARGFPVRCQCRSHWLQAAWARA
jgi:ABC-type uncharacterized transport system permease subunit